MVGISDADAALASSPRSASDDPGEVRRWSELDPKHLDVLVAKPARVQGRPGVFVVPNTEPLDLSGRIIRSGRN